MKGLDFKDWQKIASDKNCTTLKHAKGHVMTIAHSALPKILQEQLKRIKMADGGSVDDVPEPNKKNAQDMERGATQSGWQPDQWSKNLKNAVSSRQNYAEGSPDAVSSEDAPSDAPVAPDAPMQAPAPAVTPTTHITINAAPAQAPASSVSPQMVEAPVPASALQNVPRYQGNPDQIPVPYVPKAQSRDPYQNIANEAQQAVGQQQQVDIEASKQKAQIADQRLKQEQLLQDQNERNIQNVRMATERFDAYTQSHPIDPKAIYKDMSVPQKLANSIGLVLGGLVGVNGSNAENPAMAYLRNQQEKDIQAQKDRMHQQETVYGAYQKLYGDDVIASNLAAASYDRMLKLMVDASSAKLGTAQAAANAAKMGAEIGNDYVQKLGKAGQRLGAIQSGQAGAIQPMTNLGGPLSKSSTGTKGAASKEVSKAKDQQDENPYMYKPEGILSPGATAKFNDLKITPLLTPEQKSQVAEQYNRAVLADKALKALPDIMNEMHQQAGPSGYARRLAKSSGTGFGDFLGPVVGGVAGIIPGLGAAAGDAIYGTNNIQRDRDYDIAKTRLNDIVTNALKGANIAPHQIAELIDTNSPEYRDTPETHLKKMKAIEAFIKTNANVGTLEAQGLAKSK